jgi:hypothetical protein
LITVGEGVVETVAVVFWVGVVVELTILVVFGVSIM